MTEGEERPHLRPVPPLSTAESTDKEPFATETDGVITSVNYQPKPTLRPVAKPIEVPTFTAQSTEADKGPSFEYDPEKAKEAARRKVMDNVVRMDDFRRTRR